MKTPVWCLSGRDTTPEAPHQWDKIGTQAVNYVVKAGLPSVHPFLKVTMIKARATIWWVRVQRPLWVSVDLWNSRIGSIFQVKEGRRAWKHRVRLFIAGDAGDCKALVKVVPVWCRRLQSLDCYRCWKAATLSFCAVLPVMVQSTWVAACMALSVMVQSMRVVAK